MVENNSCRALIKSIELSSDKPSRALVKLGHCSQAYPPYNVFLENTIAYRAPATHK